MKVITPGVLMFANGGIRLEGWVVDSEGAFDSGPVEGHGARLNPHAAALFAAALIYIGERGGVTLQVTSGADAVAVTRTDWEAERAAAEQLERFRLAHKPRRPWWRIW